MRIRRLWLILGCLAVCGVLAGLLIQMESDRELERVYAVRLADLALSVSPDQASLERGRHLVSVVSQCGFCHGTDLGGRLMADDAWIGRLDAPNLTAGKGGLGRGFERADWVRAIRFGVRHGGRSLLLMPSAHLSQMSDFDLASVIRFMQSVPAVDRIGQPPRIGWLTRAALALGKAEGLLAAAEVERAAPRAERATPAITSEYGAYLVDLGHCRVCHHADLRGGLHPLALPGEPPPPDLRPGGAMAGWTLEDFERALRSGRTPDGRTLDREFMPWPSFAGLADTEIEALWIYLGGEGGQGR